MFRFRSDSPAFFIGVLVIGMILVVGGSVYATTVGNSITVTSALTVGTVATVSAGTAAAPSLSFSSDTDTGLFDVSGDILGFTTAGAQIAQFTQFGSFGIGTTSPGGFFALTTATSSPGILLRYTGTGPAVYVEDAANDESPFVIDAGGNVGIGTTTPGTVFGIDKVASFASATSTIESALRVTNFTATSTTATSTISTGGFQVGQAGALAAFTVGSSATTSVGVGTSTVKSHQFGVSGNALISGTVGTTTLAISSSADLIGGCIEMRAASSSTMYRIYLGNTTSNSSSNTGLRVEPGTCR